MTPTRDTPSQAVADRAANAGQPRTALWLLLILAVAAAIRVACFSGFMGYDDVGYSFIAHTMATGQFHIGEFAHYYLPAGCAAPVFPMRVGLLWPGAFLIRTLGQSEMALMVYPFLMSLAGILLAYAAGATFLGKRAGLIAAGLMALIPIDARMATEYLPDLPNAVLSAAGVLLIALSVRAASAKMGKATLGGLLLGFSWLNKECTLYIFPFVAVYVLWAVAKDRNNWRAMVGAALGVALVFGTEAAVYRHATGDAMYRLHETERNYVVSEGWHFTEGSRLGYQKGHFWEAVAKRVLHDGPKMILFNPEYGMVTTTALIAILYAILRKRRAFLFPAMWFLAWAFMFNFSSASLKHYQPLVLFDRYLVSMLIPAVVLNAGMLNELLPARGEAWRSGKLTRFLAGAMALGLVLACAYAIRNTVRTGPQSVPERTIAKLVSPNDPVATDPRAAAVLSFFWGYPATTRTVDFEAKKASDIKPGTYVLLNHERLYNLEWRYNYHAPAFARGAPPSGWQTKWKGADAEFYVVPAQMSRLP